MKRIFIPSLLVFLYAYLPAQSSPLTVSEVQTALVGEYDNFQQFWQENTQEERHRVEVEEKHLRIHTVIEAQEDEGLLMRHYQDDDTTKMLGQERLRLVQKTRGVEMQLEGPDGEHRFLWKRTTDGLLANGGEIQLALHGDTLIRIDQNGQYANSGEIPYRSIRCRFFSGWIQYPLPEDPDSTYFMAGLILHDQGDKAQLVLGEDRKVDYTVELTQLVFGKRIAIMKLALYEMQEEEVGINSRSVSYTWADPAAKRLGINIRKILSGWTLIEPNFLNSNNMNKR